MVTKMAEVVVDVVEDVVVEEEGEGEVTMTFEGKVMEEMAVICNVMTLETIRIETLVMAIVIICNNRKECAVIAAATHQMVEIVAEASVQIEDTTISAAAARVVGAEA